MGWDGARGEPPALACDLTAEEKGQRGENAACFRLASYHTAGQNARKAVPHHGELPFLYGNCT